MSERERAKKNKTGNFECVRSQQLEKGRAVGKEKRHGLANTQRHTIHGTVDWTNEDDDNDNDDGMPWHVFVN